MNPNTKSYTDFAHAYKKTHPDLQKSVQVDKAQKLWNDVKNDSKKYEETLLDLQKKMQRRESKQLSFWSNLKSQPSKEATSKPENLVEAPQSSSQSENQSVIEKPVQGKKDYFVNLFLKFLSEAVSFGFHSFIHSFIHSF